LLVQIEGLQAKQLLTILKVRSCALAPKPDE
jgi:hypothetical protein